ncbi:hypothetical protein NEAUS04_2245 [Nematocida ausubeli]|uniref:DUF1764 domain-containing protein n=1 Tax=Nematocida ausubeli (strain ATCC PRA-371 / ERTm2) TaxID=1913371 RepID=H8ZAX7_NEMA1|nr:uncharacterized protein NESG_01422 [Nematocida ausubeli]EHY66030.1 hypothetical protein NERG_00726 [Nematocida ausubeli]KAI5132547.1 hypothetical protein NEAUS06_0196 [Nematocida ausubeli]KAI5138134.1 hypothetical protein NEAUS07_2282 [Nematocida ausubeli]KAI5150852.1 hypothetical protein NEAUS05_2317 [Nematocida ausubeli]KAI5164500.1 hypothetical protein NEAUS04_2245 [Nematocida ausubeli]
MASPIDDIFAQKPKDIKPNRKTKTKKEKPYEVRGSSALEQDIFSCDGYKIYTQEELKIGRGGNTPNCPIDCDCCF